METTAIVIDDDNDTVEVFSEYLETKNISVIAKGHNGKDALELYKKFKPNIVLMDVMMPDHDGAFGLQEIRKFDPNSKIILVTASVSNHTYEKLIELNASAIVYKPYDINHLLDIIDRVKNGESKIIPTRNA